MSHVESRMPKSKSISAQHTVTPDRIPRLSFYCAKGSLRIPNHWHFIYSYDFMWHPIIPLGISYLPFPFAASVFPHCCNLLTEVNKKSKGSITRDDGWCRIYPLKGEKIGVIEPEEWETTKRAVESQENTRYGGIFSEKGEWQQNQDREGTHEMHLVLWQWQPTYWLTIH